MRVQSFWHNTLYVLPMPDEMPDENFPHSHNRKKPFGLSLFFQRVLVVMAMVKKKWDRLHFIFESGLQLDTSKWLLPQWTEYCCLLDCRKQNQIGSLSYSSPEIRSLGHTPGYKKSMHDLVPKIKPYRSHPRDNLHKALRALFPKIKPTARISANTGWNSLMATYTVTHACYYQMNINKEPTDRGTENITLCYSDGN